MAKSPNMIGALAAQDPRLFWAKVKPCRVLKDVEADEIRVAFYSDISADAFCNGVSRRLPHGTSIEVIDEYRGRALTRAWYQNKWWFGWIYT